MTGDGDADVASLVTRYRHELRVHCYRMLGSFDEAEDLVQETFLRAWRGRSSFEGRASVRTWLYKIATNACLDFLDQNRRRPAVLEMGVAAVKSALQRARSTVRNQLPRQRSEWSRPASVTESERTVRVVRTIEEPATHRNGQKAALSRRRVAEAKDQLRTALAWIRSRHPDVAVESEVVQGDPAAKLVHAARGAELLIISGGRHLPTMIGTSTESNLMQSDRPVIVVRAESFWTRLRAMAEPAGPQPL